MTPESGESDAYGETVSNLQQNVQIDGTKISGTLLHKEGYTGFSKTDNTGNFLALKVEYPENAEVKVTIVGGSTSGKKMTDHQLVTKVANKEQKIQLDVTQNGESGTVTYDLSGLELKTGDE